MGDSRRFTHCNLAKTCKNFPNNFMIVGHMGYEFLVCDKHKTVIEKRCAKHNIPITMSFKTGEGKN